ncbi:MAG TPA: copper amine oxidase N-terminal domain-containing protein, partial [Firmicutes bacterium]|nr:copper amine oxidase N-terminal domain-containing protein [Bacillota bacterium]
VNGQEVFTDVPPELKNDRLWVPVRALAEALGCQVQYEASNERILVRPASGDVISLAALPSSDRGRFGREIIVGRPLPAKNGRLLAPVKGPQRGLGLYSTVGRRQQSGLGKQIRTGHQAPWIVELPPRQTNSWRWLSWHGLSGFSRARTRRAPASTR